MAESALPGSSTAFGERVRRRLREEHVIWIITVGKDGTPQPNPVGFLYQDDGSVLIYNMVNAHRLKHVVDRSQVALHFDGDGTGGDIVVFTGTACRADDIPSPHENQAFLAKYGDSLLQVSGSSRCLCGSRSHGHEASEGVVIGIAGAAWRWRAQLSRAS
jgi:PPOX class probable F420-dependent enzyme